MAPPDADRRAIGRVNRAARTSFPAGRRGRRPHATRIHPLLTLVDRALAGDRTPSARNRRPSDASGWVSHPHGVRLDVLALHLKGVGGRAPAPSPIITPQWTQAPGGIVTSVFSAIDEPSSRPGLYLNTRLLHCSRHKGLIAPVLRSRSSSLAGVSPVRVAASWPVAGWRSCLKMVRSKPSVKGSEMVQPNGPQHQAKPAVAASLQDLPGDG